MMVGSTVLIVLTSGLALAASVLSPMTGLIALAFLAPFPRPLVIPSPGLYVALLGAVFLGMILRLPIERPRLGWPALEVSLIVAFLLYVAALFAGGVLFGSEIDRANPIAVSFSQMLTAVLTFVAARLLLRGRSPYPVLSALLASAALASATAFAQAIGVEGMFGGLMGDSDLVNPTAVDRVTGPLLDPNYFGAYLVTATTLGVACAVVATSIRLRAVLLALSAFIGAAMVLTLSRGALVALVAGLTTIAFTRSWRAGVLMVGSMLLVAVIAWPFFAEVRYAANPDVASGGLASQLENSDRTDAWFAGLDVFLSKPLFGVGWGRLVDEASTGISAHNWYVALLGETGITGFLLWGLFTVASVLALRRKSSSARTVGYAVIAAWMAASMFIEVPKVYASTGLAIIVVAAAIGAEWPARNRTPEKPVPRAVPRSSMLPTRAGRSRAQAGRPATGNWPTLQR